MGVFGRFGFYEAVDFTKGRNNGGFSIVRSFMSHHVGMSMLSAVNMLKDNCMQRRFMSDSFMNGAESLLEEKIQTGATVENFQCIHKQYKLVICQYTIFIISISFLMHSLHILIKSPPQL